MRNVLSTIVGLAFLLWVTADTSEESTACDVGGDCSWESSPPSLHLFGDLVSSHHPDCFDKNERDCPMKALLNACAKNPDTMLDECPFSCGLCNNHNLEKGQVKTCYGELQNVNNNEHILNVIRESQRYMTRQVFVNETYANIRSSVSFLGRRREGKKPTGLEISSMKCVLFPFFFFVSTVQE